jgi:phosphoglycerol transferase MdoB-like AlkP superfamily enzyme
VWGISDKNLFLEANKVLKEQTRPFFAIIQTADNHRPYTIPAEDRPHLQLRNLPGDSLRKYGFSSNEELNAFTYMDYTYKTFFEAAAKEKYFNNTIFVFVGDHGIRGDAKDMFPKVWTEQGLTCQHVPLLFYAPSMLQPQVIDKKVSQVDIMPSVAALSGMPVRYTTMGRNIFDTATGVNSYSFVLDPDEQTIGLAGADYFFQYSFRTKKEAVYSMKDNRVLPPGEPSAELLHEMRNLTMGYYETARYLLFNNKRQRK